MNPMFPFVVCFGVAVFAIVLAQLILSIRMRLGSTPPPWMRSMRQAQDAIENNGWRIQMIPYDDGAKPVVIQWRGLLAIVQAIGPLGFVTALGMMTYDRDRFLISGPTLAGISFALMLCGAWIRARQEREGWIKVKARCVDRELRKILIPRRGGGTWGWFWRVVCEYEEYGRRFRVTPKVRWANLTSEEAALRFMKEHVSPDGGCILSVNPKNPFQTELSR